MSKVHTSPSMINGKTLPVPVPPGLKDEFTYQKVRWGGKDMQMLSQDSRMNVIQAVARQEKVDPAHLYGIAKVESNFIARDGMGKDGRSSHGMAQMTLQTAAGHLGKNVPAEDALKDALNHPTVAFTLMARNIKDGLSYASRKISENGEKDSPEVRAKYVSVHYNTKTSTRNAFDGDVSKLPEITQGHIAKTLAGMQEYRQLNGGQSRAVQRASHEVRPGAPGQNPGQDGLRRPTPEATKDAQGNALKPAAPGQVPGQVSGQDGPRRLNPEAMTYTATGPGAVLSKMREGIKDTLTSANQGNPGVMHRIAQGAQNAMSVAVSYTPQGMLAQQLREQMKNEKHGEGQQDIQMAQAMVMRQR